MGQSIGVTAVLLLSLVGVLAGFLNTVASSGSALTLPTMIALGLHPVMANATNRVPIVVGCAVAVWKFHRAGQLPWGVGLRLSSPLLAGAVVGLILALNLGDLGTGSVTTLAVLMAVVVVLFNPSKWLHADHPDVSPQTGPLVMVVMAAIGVWGGLIALDSATYTLAALVLLARFPIREANAIKVLGLGLVALLGMIAFAMKGEIEWLWALPLSGGGIVGSLAGTRVSLGHNASKWIFWLLVVVLAVETVGLAVRYL